MKLKILLTMISIIMIYISDYNSFFKNIPEVKDKNISSMIDNKENFNNNNELKSFMESIILDDFYQSLL